MQLTRVSTLMLVLLPLCWGADSGSSGNEITTVQSMTLERVLKPANVASTLPSLIPATTLAGVVSGSLEIRERFVYPPASGVLNYLQFSVPAGTPLPTPSSLGISGSTYFVAVLAVQKISVGSNPTYPSVQFSGIVASTEGPLGSVTGAAGALSFGYGNDKLPVFTNVLSSIAGVSSGYSATAVGDITLIQVPVSSSTCSLPVIIVAPTMTTTSDHIELDASKSFDCTGQPLTFKWGALDPLGSVTLVNPSSPIAFAYLNNGPGQYSITVTATSTNAASSVSTILVTYTKP